MTALVSVFGGSLILISGFFAFKDWERQRGRDTRLTAFLKAHSPRVETLFRRVRTYTARVFAGVHAAIEALVHVGFHHALTTVRTGFIVLGAHMIRAARGEHLMAEGKIPSTYFKLLHRHKEKIQDTEIPAGIARPDVLRKVKIQTRDEVGGGETVAQVQ